MLGKIRKNIEINGESVIEETKDGITTQTAVEGYRATINSVDPEDITLTRWFVCGAEGTKESKTLYKSNRATCNADYSAFLDQVYAVQDNLIAEQG